LLAVAAQVVLLAMRQVAVVLVGTGLRLGTLFQQDRRLPLLLVAGGMAALAAVQMTGHKEAVQYLEPLHPQVVGMAAAVLLVGLCKGMAAPAVLGVAVLILPQPEARVIRLQLLRHKEIMVAMPTAAVVVLEALDLRQHSTAQTTGVLA